MTIKERPLYSQAWLANYGRTLTREEIRLVQAFRALVPRKQAALLTLASGIALDDAVAASRSQVGHVGETPGTPPTR